MPLFKVIEDENGNRLEVETHTGSKVKSVPFNKERHKSHGLSTKDLEALEVADSIRNYQEAIRFHKRFSNFLYGDRYNTVKIVFEGNRVVNIPDHVIINAYTKIMNK